MSVDEEIVISRKTVFVRVEEAPVLGERGPRSREKGAVVSRRSRPPRMNEPRTLMRQS